MKDKKKKLNKEVEELKAKCEEYLAGWQRAQADYENFKKETDQKISEVSGFARVAVLAELIPILDNFTKAVAHVPEEQAGDDWVVGVFHIKKQLEDFLAQKGLEKIKTVGEEFDPNLHEAVGKEPASAEASSSAKATDDKSAGKKGEKDIIIKEVSSGYKLNGDVIIPAKVIVGE